MIYNSIDIANKIIFNINNEDGGDNITNLRLQKLLYYLQGYFIAFYDKKLFDDKIEVGQYGPIVYNVYNNFSSLSGKNIFLSVEEEKLFQEVLSVKGQFTASKLMNFFYEDELPFLEVKDGELTYDSLKNYFKNK